MTWCTVPEPANGPGLPLVSVIVPHKCGLEMIKECVESLLESDYPNKEIIVIDNNSMDGSPAYLESKYATQVHVLRSPMNLYYAAALNLGMKCAHGAFILFLNDDTKVSSTYLSKLVTYMESDSSVGATTGLVVSCDAPFRAAPVVMYVDQFFLYAIEADPMRLDPSKRVHEIFGTPGTAMMVRRELLERIGGFDDQLVLWWEEADLGWKIRLAGYKCVLVRDAIVYHRGGVTTSQVPEDFSAFHSWKNRQRILLKYSRTMRLPIVLPVVIIVTILSALDEVHNRKIHVAAAKVRAILWNLRHAPETLRAREYVRLHVRKVPDSVVYALIRPDFLLLRAYLSSPRKICQASRH